MKELQGYYLKYKKQILPIAFIMLSVFIIFAVIMPQISSISDTKAEVQDQTDEFNTLSETLRTVSTVTQADTESNLQLANRALPNTKDISIIFTALNSAATESDAELRDFSLKIGGLFGKAEKTAGVKGIPSIDVIANIYSATPSSFVKFSQKVQAKLPLSEVKKIDISGDKAKFELSFYYKPYDLAALARKGTVAPLSTADQNLLNQIMQWGEE